MKNNKIERLSALRDELAQITAPVYPNNFWPLINSLIAKATPIIRHDWPDFFDDFQKITAEPNAPRVVTYTDFPNISVEEHRRQWEMDNAETKEVQQNTLGFINGLLSLSDAPRLSGAFYLLAMLLSVVLPFLVYVLIHDLFVTGFILFAAVLLFALIGAFHLRQNELLSEKNFIELIGMVFKQIPSLFKGRTS